MTSLAITEAPFGSIAETRRVFSSAANPQLAENSRPGFERKNRTQAQSFEALNSQTMQRNSWHLIGRTASGPSVYLYDGANAIQEVDGSGNVLARYAQSRKMDALLAESRSGSTSYYEVDDLGSATSLSGSSGTILSTYAYDAFGNLSASTGSLTNPFRYTGRESDSETGLYSYRARYYDPNLGRFLTEDPIHFGGGINFYSYVFQNPTTYKDPTGKFCIYSQSTGSMRCFPACRKPRQEKSCSLHREYGMPYYSTQGYSGTGEGRNNPDAQDESYSGPIPRGVWVATGGWHYVPKPGPGQNVMNLDPLNPGGDCFGTGRECDTFRLHGNNAANDASEGCVVLPADRTIIPSGETVEVTE